jgi:hypothetical protein
LTVTKFVSRLDLSESKVDRENNVIKGVSLVSLGEARGHKKFADQKTLEQVRDCAKKYKSGLRVMFNPNTFNHGDASLAGYIPSSSIVVQDGKVLGDLHVFDSYASKNYLYEMAENTPDIFGLSIEFNGVPEEINGEQFARCDEIFAATIVDLPAANKTGLFRADLTTDNDKQISETNTKKNMDEKEVTKLIQDTLKSEVPNVVKETLTQFRSQQGSDASGDPTQDEMDAAGCTADDTDEQVTSKVNDWRTKKGNKPFTVRDAMQLFKFTGGKPARASGEITDDEKNKGKTTFETLVTKYRATGMTDVKAQLRAKEDNPEAYNDFCQRGRPNISTKTSK